MSEHIQPAAAAKRLLFVHRGEGEPTPPAFAAAMAAAGWTVDQLMISHHAPRRGIPDILFSGRSFGRYDLIVAGEYNLAWALCLRTLFARRPRLVALGFNQSARLILTKIAPVDRLLNRIWRRIAAFLVHSRDEARLFAKVHAIPGDRFFFAHWGYDLPTHDAAKTPLPPAPFVSMIGRNNRDVVTFMRACELAGIRGVAVTSADLAGKLQGPVPAGVTILADRSMEDCLNFVAGSLAHLVLVSDGERGAGHISAVSAMLLGKPQIFSRVATIADYLDDGVNGLAVPLADPAATAAAMLRLRDDPALCERLGEAGRVIAREQMSHAASLEKTVALLLAVGQGRPLPAS